MTAAVRNALFAFSVMLLATTGAAGAKDSGATAAVAKFYDWYLTQHGNVDWYAPQHGRIDWDRATHEHTKKYFQARAMLHPVLFAGLDDTYVKSIGDRTPPFYVNTTPALDAKNMSGFDPFAGASSPATSYRLGSSWGGRINVAGAGEGQLRAVTLVPATFEFANTHAKTQLTLVVRKNGSSYQIYDIWYGPISFYYSGPIRDLLDFLGKYNC